METIKKIIGSWETWAVIGLFIVSLFIMEGIDYLVGDEYSALPALGFIPAFITMYFLFGRKWGK